MTAIIQLRVSKQSVNSKDIKDVIVFPNVDNIEAVANSVVIQWEKLKRTLNLVDAKIIKVTL